MDIMAEKLENKFFRGFKITNISFDDLSKQAFIYLEPKDGASCPHCHSHNVVVHEYIKR